MFMTVTVVQTTSQFCIWSFVSFLKGWFLSFPYFVIGGRLMKSAIFTTLLLGHLLMLFSLEFSVLVKILFL
jgi:hypothetical protein